MVANLWSHSEENKRKQVVTMCLMVTVRGKRIFLLFSKSIITKDTL